MTRISAALTHALCDSRASVGLGQYYCMQCARHFIDVRALDTHNRTKSHKRRVRELRDKPYGVDLEDVYGKKIDNGPPLRRNLQVIAEQEAAAAAEQQQQQQQ